MPRRREPRAETCMVRRLTDTHTNSTSVNGAISFAHNGLVSLKRQRPQKREETCHKASVITPKHACCHMKDLTLVGGQYWALRHLISKVKRDPCVGRVPSQLSACCVLRALLCRLRARMRLRSARLCSKENTRVAVCTLLSRDKGCAWPALGSATTSCHARTTSSREPGVKAPRRPEAPPAKPRLECSASWTVWIEGLAAVPNGTHLLRICSLLVICDTFFRNVCSDFLRFRQRSNPLVVIEKLRGGFFSFFENMSCVLLRNRHSSGKSPIAHFIVRMSSPRNRRLLSPAPAKEMTASRCSCRSPVGPSELMGASLTCGSDAMPVLLRPCSLIASCAALYLPFPHVTRAA